MEVILKEDYLALGYVGDRIKVRGGFARNFLLPRGIAIEASARNERLLNHQLAAILSKRQKRKAEAEEFGKVVSQIIVEFTLKIGEQGRSFGSITARDIEAALKNLGYTVDRKQIRIVEPIRTAGAHKVDVKLHAEVSVPLQVKVIAEKTAAPAVSADDKPAKRGRKKSAKAETEEAPVQETAADEDSES